MFALTPQERVLLFFVAVSLAGGTLFLGVSRLFPAAGSAMSFIDHRQRTVKVDVNTADFRALDALPGIGPQIAHRIIRERQRRGGFFSIEDLRSVKGLSAARFSRIKGVLEVSRPP